MNYYVYVLINQKDNQLYIGSTPDLKARLEKHKNGYVKANSYRRPLKLIYYESYISETDARKREVYLKGGKAHEELKVQLQETYKKVNYKNRF